MNNNTITLKNSFLSAKIKIHGAEIISITDKDGVERIWYGDENLWEDHAPVLFPVCGFLVEDTYLLNGKSFTMNPHGFAKCYDYVLESFSEDKAVFLLTSNNETKACYPFDFEFRVSYTLSENKLVVTYTVNNLTDGEMYFSVGSHEGYLCEGNISDYNLIFENGEEPINHLLAGAFLSGKTEKAPITNGVMEMCDREFKRLDTYIFKNPLSKSVTLKKKGAQKSITVEFPEAPNLLIWKEPGAEFLCIEPWCGLPDHDGEIRELSEKDGIVKLEKNGVFTNTHTIIID